MSIKFAILGFLSWQAMSGYDLKKRFTETEFLPWSGNNNQIYRPLTAMYKDGLVSSTVQEQESLPNKKLYRITNKGRTVLRAWLESKPEPLTLKNLFLMQLAWADALDASALDSLLAQYTHQVETQLLIYREEQRRGFSGPARTPREQYLWQMMADNHIQHYQLELNWVQALRQNLNSMGDEQ